MLFERGAHGVQPTAEGQLLSERAIETLGALAALQEAVRGIAAGTRGRLGLGSFPTASEVLAPRALARFGRDFGDVEVRLEDGEPQSCSPGCSRATSTSSSSFATTWSRRAGRPAVCVRRCSPSLCVLVLVPLGGPRWNGTPSGPVPLTDFADASWISTREGNRGHPGPRTSLRRRWLRTPDPLSQQRLRRRPQLRPGRPRSRGGAPPGLPRPRRVARCRRDRSVTSADTSRP